MAKKLRYVVATGKSILDTKNGRHLMGGTILDPDHFKKEWLEDAIKSKHVRIIGAHDEGDEDEIPSKLILKNEDKSAEAVVDGAGADATKQTVAVRPIGKWNVNPESIKGKALAELNVMVRERDSHMKPFKDKAEAIAQLSADFEKAD